MSSMLGRSDARDLGRALPEGQLVGNYRSYLDAQKVVDYLADQNFPVQHVSIIGNDLKTVERVTGRLSYPRVALSGAATGAWFGLFVGLLLMLFGNTPNYGPVLSSIAMGAAFWMLFGIISYALQRGKRDFTSTNQVIATSYDVVVASEVANEAHRLAAQLPVTGTVRAGQPPHGYGQAPQQPQRPAQWGEDPFARDRQQATGGQGGPAEHAGTQPEQVPPGVPVGGSYPDLPDGRPQFGVRLPQQPAATQEPAAERKSGTEGREEPRQD
ncbi:ECF transporter S component [Arthrobacter sp. I2-34]|uniref:ECF transporter S component n=1 Tax=Arthrobacter hankyongi TaxID=2904801 RepID=A0ABS9L847_9MICC|nr:general stress protein [Arthrobacter hankyongi]MCG2622805.1 ECF transporter S component [Arthrobacter hankyongi]